MLVLKTEILLGAMQVALKNGRHREQTGFSCAGPVPDLDSGSEKCTSLEEAQVHQA